MTHTETQLEAYARAEDAGIINASEERVLGAAKALEAAGRHVTQEAIAEALGATGGDRRPIGSAVAVLKRRCALKVVGKVEGSRGFNVESYRVTGEMKADPGAPQGRVSRSAVVNYLATCSEEEWNAILTEASARAPQ